MKIIYPLFSLICLLSISFSNEDASIEEKLVQKCIDAHGGMEGWKSLNKTVYSKNIVLFMEDGEVEKEILQYHNYTTVPSLSGTIEWSDSLDRKVSFQDGQAFKMNGAVSEEPTQSALNTFNSAYYVLNMPWKLMDETAKITYLGLDTILNHKVVHTLKVEYPTVDKSDVWEYYLDKEEHYLVANMVHHGVTYSMITNDEYTEYRGLKFNAKRTSYMVDSLGKVLYQRAKYEYIFE